MNREMINSSIEKRYIILEGNGVEYELKKFKLKNNYELMNKFIKEEQGRVIKTGSPKSIKAMQKLELVDYEGASDSGHLRFYPKGNLVFDLIRSWAEEIALNRLNALKIETPMLYDYNEPDIKEQVESFHENHYIVNAPNKDKEFILRFAGDFGLFRMIKDARLSYKNLPLRVYEYSKSFRYEKSGSLVGLKRLRGFSMPDLHSFTENLEHGFLEYKEIFKNFYNLAKAMDINFVIVFRAVESFYYQHKKELLELVQYVNMPVYIELLSSMKHYWAIKSEFQAVDCNDGFLQLSTVQLDIKDAKTYGINYLDDENKQKGCIICHSSIGSIERWMYSVLEHSLMKEKPMLPYWLSPVQLRLIPVNSEHIEKCIELAHKLKKCNIRVDIDDRDERIGRKIKISEENWIPYLIVIGEKEVQGLGLKLRARSMEEIEKENIEQIIDYLKTKQNNMPFINMNLNELVSKQVIFR